MKTMIILMLAAVIFCACTANRSHDGIYVSHIQGDLSIADDTLIIKDTIILNKTGFRKIRNGGLGEKGYKRRQWTLNSADAPALQFAKDKVILGNTVYERLP